MREKKKKMEKENIIDIEKLEEYRVDDGDEHGDNDNRTLSIIKTDLIDAFKQLNAVYEVRKQIENDKTWKYRNDDKDKIELYRKARMSVSNKYKLKVNRSLTGNKIRQEK